MCVRGTRPKRRRDGRQTKTDDGRLDDDDDDLPPSPSCLPPLSADSSHSRLHSRERKDQEKERGPFGIATTATALSLLRARPSAPALKDNLFLLTSVGTVLAFSVFFGLRVFQVFVRVSGRVFGPYLLCEKDYHTTRDGWSWHHFEGGHHCEEGAMVDMGLVFCIKVNLWTIQRSVTIVELDMGMSFNTIVR